MASNGFFNNYFYGKSGKKDFTEADLPANRLQLLRDVLRVRMGALMGVNFLYLLCWIPAIIWTFLNLVQLYTLDTADPAAFQKDFQGILYTWLLVMFPLTAITGPFNMGVSRVLRNWARDEHSFVLDDFRESMKANWKQGLVYALICGAVPLLLFICLSFYAGMAAQSPLFYLPMGISLLAAVLWWCASPILPTLIVTYDLSFGAQLKNALLLTMAKFPRALAIRLASLIPLILVAGAAMFLPSAVGWITGVAVVLYMILLPALNKLVFASHANALCEAYLNPKIEGARSGIGLRPK